MPFDGFIHPGLALGALLASVPLLIHLLNRQRHQPLPWAAMRFVMAAYRKTRRRAQLENLILLLLRMAAVALLALAVARPFTGRDSPLAPLTESRRDLLLVVDGSASTGYREGVESVFEAVLRRSRELVSDLDGTRGDRVRLLLAGDHVRLLSTRTPDDALSMLTTLGDPTDESLDLPAALAEVVAAAEEEAAGSGTSQLEVRVLTDLQRRSFSPAAIVDEAGAEEGVEHAASPLFGALDRLEELGVRVVVEDLGPPTTTPPNLGVTAIEPLHDVLGAGLPTDVGVRVANHGTGSRSGVRVSLAVDGERVGSQQVDVPARGTAEATFTVVFRDGGHHVLEAELEGDRLAADDRRSHVLDVPPPVRVLLVDGDPADAVERDEVGYLRTVLEPARDDSLGGLPGSGGYAPFLTRTVTAMAFGGSDEDFAETDVVVLANVGVLSASTVERLEAFVASGGGLVISLGDHATGPGAVEGWNARLWRADGSGLLPGRLGRATVLPKRAERYFRAADFDATHPVLAFFADERWKPLFAEVPIYGFVAVEPSPGSRVLARLDDDGASPLLLERDYDHGRVLLWTSTLDREWNRIPESPGTLIPLVHELLRHAGSRTEAPRNGGIGTPLAAEVTSFPRNPVLVRPDGTRAPLDGEPEPLAQGLWRLPQSPPADAIGTWRIEIDDAPDVSFAIQLAPSEGDLDRMAAGELEASHAVWHVYDVEDGSDDDVGPESPERGELWRGLAFLALVLLVAETLWAAWIGRQRRLA